MNFELNHDFVHCYRCYGQPTARNSSFVVCICKHIFCENCRRSDRSRTTDSMYCFVCRKPVKFKHITPNDLPANVRQSFESNTRFVEQFANTAGFQSGIQNRFTDKLFKDIEYWDKVGDEQDAMAKELEARCQQLEDGITSVEAKSLQHMSQERYSELLGMADDELDRMSYPELVGASEDHAHSKPQLSPSVTVIDPHTPLLRQVLLKNTYSSNSRSHSPN